MLKQSGITLIEVVVTIVIASIAVASLILFTSKSTERSADPMIQLQAAAIAQAYMEEIMQKNFCDPDFDPDGDSDIECADPTAGVGCTESACDAGSTNTCGGPNGPTPEGTNRSIFDDVCDYTNLPDNTVRDQDGNAISGLNNYSVNVQVIDDATAALNGLAGNNGQVLRIDVTVSHPVMESDIMVSGFRTNFER